MRMKKLRYRQSWRCPNFNLSKLASNPNKAMRTTFCAQSKIWVTNSSKDSLSWRRKPSCLRVRKMPPLAENYRRSTLIWLTWRRSRSTKTWPISSFSMSWWARVICHESHSPCLTRRWKMMISSKTSPCIFHNSYKISTTSTTTSKRLSAS